MDDNDVTETIERRALLGWYEAASQLGLPGCDWRIEEIGDALCSVSSMEPSILVNRVLGLGTRSTPTAEQLAEIRRLYREAGRQRFFLQVEPDVMNSDLQELLFAAGYQRHRGWMKFTRGPGEVGPVNTDLAIGRVDAGQAAEFAAIAAPAFGLTLRHQPVLAALANDPNWHLYVSFEGVRPAGTGALYISGDAAYTDWGATHPDFRRRGSQTAILKTRIRDALAAGCQTIETMTGEAAAGDPQHSYKNILKAGFSEAYLRENWVPVDR